MKNKFVISGVTGFVGTNLKPYLNRRNIEVIGLSREENLIEDIFAYKNCDISLLSNSEAFIHLAGKAHDLRKGVSNEEYFRANTDLTINLFDKFLKSDCRVFIYLSSVKAVADTVDSILTEDTMPKPITAYGKSKLKAEQYILSKVIPKEKRVYILRPCMIHGPNNKGNLNLLYQCVNKGIPYPMGRFDNKRSFLSVENLCFVIENLIEKKPESGVYNIADDEPISTKELIRIISKGFNKNPRILNIHPFLINTFAKFGTYLGLPFNDEKLQKLTESFVVSNEKIKMKLGVSIPIGAKIGLQRTVESFTNNS